MKFGSLIVFALLAHMLPFFCLAHSPLPLFDVNNNELVEQENEVEGPTRWSWNVKVNFEALNGNEISLNFSPNTTIIAHKKRIEFRSTVDYSWFGTIPSDRFGSINFVVRDGLLTGQVSYRGRLFKLGPGPDSTQQIEEMLNPPIQFSGDFIQPFDDESWAADSLPTSQLSDHYNPLPPTLKGATTLYIDVLVLYSITAEASGAGIEAEIQAAIDYANTALENSGCIFQYHLVRAQRTNYTDSGTLLTDLNRLGDKDDGFIDDASSLRDSYGADLVSLWVGTTDSLIAGYAHQQTASLDKESVYSVIYRGATHQGAVVAHELGHNIGGIHEVADTPNGGAYSYSHAYTYESGSTIEGAKGFYTLMYSGITFCGSCERIPFFSTPNKTNSGSNGTTPNLLVGNSTTDNARGFNNLAEGIANFRGSKAFHSQQDYLKVEDSLINKNCFIATAAYGSQDHYSVQQLRKFRDQHLMPYVMGRLFVQAYYRLSPPIASYISTHIIMKNIVRFLLSLLILLITFPLSSLLFIGLGLFGFYYLIKNRKSSLTAMIFILANSYPNKTNAQFAFPSLDLTRGTEMASIVPLRPFIGAATGINKESGETTRPEAEGEKSELSSTDYNLTAFATMIPFGAEILYKSQNFERDTGTTYDDISATKFKVALGMDFYKENFAGVKYQKRDSKLESNGNETTEENFGVSYTFLYKKFLTLSAEIEYARFFQTGYVDNQWLQRTLALGLQNNRNEFGYHFDLCWFHSPRSSQPQQGEEMASHHAETNKYRGITEFYYYSFFVSGEYAQSKEIAPTIYHYSVDTREVTLGLGLIRAYEKLNIGFYYTNVKATENNDNTSLHIFELNAGLTI